jgi:hypothetical protein
MTIDEIELVLLREIVENKSTCREAAMKIAEWMEAEEPNGYGVVKDGFFTNSGRAPVTTKTA